MFFALLTKNRERNMATPEETRDRIKEMRDRIFKDSDKGSAQNNIQETSRSTGFPIILTPLFSSKDTIFAPCGEKVEIFLPPVVVA